MDGFSLHAGVRVHANDRKGLERLCRYVTRPPLAVERLTEGNRPHSAIGHLTPVEFANQIRTEAQTLSEVS